MNYHQKLEAMREFVENNFQDVKDAVDFFEITIEDICSLFPDRLVDCYERVYPMDLGELDKLSELEEEQAWLGVETFGVVIPKEGWLDD